MQQDRATRHMNTLPRRLNAAEFAGRPPGTFLVARVEGQTGPAGDSALHITLRTAPPGPRQPNEAAFFPAPATDLVYSLPDDAPVD
jgi:hypothetical protein